MSNLSELISSGGGGGGFILGFAVVSMSAQTIYSSHNVSSVSFSSGDFQIFWDVDPPDEDYGIAISHLQPNGNEYQTGVQVRPQDYPGTYTGSTKIAAYLNSGGTNIGWVSVLMYHAGA